MFDILYITIYICEMFDSYQRKKTSVVLKVACLVEIPV